MAEYHLLNGNCLEELKTLNDNTIDSIVTDPPYELGFMGKAWDASGIAFNVDVWKECLRVLKPGGHILAFGGTRTYHRMTVAIEDAGFDIRDCLAWMYGSGFPKSHNIIKQIEKENICQFIKNAKTNNAITQLKHFQVELNEGKIDSVLTNVVMYQEEGVENKTVIGVVVDSSPTDMSIFATKQDIEQNTILSLNNLLEENLKKGKKFITLTELRQIIELKIFNLLQNQSTLKSIETLHGTALKPAFEPVVMGRKPFKGTIAENVLEWGVGGLNIDECRIGYKDEADEKSSIPGSNVVNEKNSMFGINGEKYEHNTQGRWPANVMLECICENPKVVKDKYDIRTYDNYKNTFQSYEENDSTKGEYKIKDVETTAIVHTDPNCPCYILDQQSGTLKGFASQNCNNQMLYGGNALNASSTARNGFKQGYNDTGGASRFFYCPKTSKKDRNEGMVSEAKSIKGRDEGQDKLSVAYKARPTERQNIHPTVKPTELMEYLIKLVTPKGGTVLDPFMGSGSTGKGAALNDYSFIGIELSPEYFEIAKQRINHIVDKRKFW